VCAVMVVECENGPTEDTALRSARVQDEGGGCAVSQSDSLRSVCKKVHNPLAECSDNPSLLN